MSLFGIRTPTGATIGVVGHVPHAATRIPSEIRAGILLGDDELAAELVRLTDWHVDDLFAWLPSRGAALFVNQLSRVVFDPERFPSDEDEPMAGIGQGVVYSHTTDGRPLQSVSAEERALRIAAFYDPYHEALTTLVREALETRGRCLLLDCHSFATAPLQSEPDQSQDRPDICIGTDPVHTPSTLAAALELQFAGAGFSVRRNAPFAGSLVPLAYYGSEPRVSSVMIEVRRGLYCDETSGQLTESFSAVSDAVERGVRAACADWFGAP